MNDEARDELWERIHRQDEYVARRKVAYDEVLRLGRERDQLELAMAKNMSEILRVIRDARGDLTIDEAATAIGVSRQTVHRWLRIGDALNGRQ